MAFRKDINGLRAIAVIAVVLFHFNPEWMPGGFSGVDVFFVISGFLMTGIIFRGIEQGNFSILKFYFARANRIIPALSALCFFLLVFGWFYLAPFEYQTLSKHIASSISFLSNIIYWRESGYFDAVSHEKWLLHTWSLSVEWQFYIIYPLVLIFMSKVMPIKAIKTSILLGTVLAFIISIIATYQWPNPAYFLLPTRAWEMMIGGIAYLYPLSLHDKKKKIVELVGLALIITTYLFVSKENIWPGFLALIPTLGTFLIIQAERENSFITSNFIFQKIGTWSYSIYLWHWPLVVATYYFSMNEGVYLFIGIILSIILGQLSYRHIETIKFRDYDGYLTSYLKYKPIYMALIILSIGSIIFSSNGLIEYSPSSYQTLINEAKESPYRQKCHISTYQSPSSSCEYFGEKVEWVILGDSHSTEIAYALAEKLEPFSLGVKHFSFSNCKPSFLENDDFSRCSKWYNEVISYILDNDNIKNVVFNHRFTSYLFGGDGRSYPELPSQKETEETKRLIKSIDKLILKLSKSKDNVYIFNPIPELQKGVHELIGHQLVKRKDLSYIYGTSLAWYHKRNKYIIEHFRNNQYGSNVHLIKTQNAFCDNNNCFAVKNTETLYFDDNHPSILGARKILDLMRIYSHHDQ